MNIQSQIREYGVKITAKINGAEVRNTVYTPEDCHDAAPGLANVIYDLLDFAEGDKEYAAHLIDYLEADQ